VVYLETAIAKGRFGVIPEKVWLVSWGDQRIKVHALYGENLGTLCGRQPPIACYQWEDFEQFYVTHSAACKVCRGVVQYHLDRAAKVVSA
jgi:hypothetical protein